MGVCAWEGEDGGVTAGLGEVGGGERMIAGHGADVGGDRMYGHCCSDQRSKFKND